MITALQNFISKQSKFLFPILLVVIVVSFVLYLSQGSSVFDLLPDPTREKKELYGVDLNDPDQRRLVTLSNRVASDFGAIISPSDEAMEKADRQFLENLQSQIQAAFQANQEDIDRNALQRLFGFMQQWPNLPKSLKVKEIARSGLYDFEFSESSAQSKITLDGQADKWGFLPLSINHPKINLRFDDFLRSLDPGLSEEANRTRAMQFVGQRHGFTARDTETILYSLFRAMQVDQTYNQGGVALNKEAELDLHGEQFAWDAEVISLDVEDLNLSDPVIAELTFSDKIKVGDSLSVSYGNRDVKFEFSSGSKDKNGSVRYVPIASAIFQTIETLQKAIDEENFGFVSRLEDKTLSLLPVREKLPTAKPSFSSEGDAVSISGTLDEVLVAYHEENKLDAVFEEPSRTFATALTFASKDYLQVPPAPDEARMLSYFERNKGQFVPPAPPPVVDQNGSEGKKGEKGPVGPKDANQSDSNSTASDSLELDLLAGLEKDLNQSAVPEVTFEQVREQVRQSIIEGDRLDAERYAETAARDAALEFLDEINSLQDKLRIKYSTYEEKRRSAELAELIAQRKAQPRSISFSAQDISMQGAILGLERRESERRSNRQPLEEVAGLSERAFFTRSVRKARDGYVVFVLDRKTAAGPGEYDRASFRDLYNGYADSLRSKAFLDRADEEFTKLSEGNASTSEIGLKVEITRKSSSAVRADYDKQSSQLSRELTQLQNERTEISDAERDENATVKQLARKVILDQEIEDLREQQADLNRERSLATRLVDACPTLQYQGPWEELERSDSEVVFARLLGVYTLRAKEQSDEQIANRVLDLEFARAEGTRGDLVQDLITKGFKQ